MNDKQIPCGSALANRMSQPTRRALMAGAFAVGLEFFLRAHTPLAQEPVAGQLPDGDTKQRLEGWLYGVRAEAGKSLYRWVLERDRMDSLETWRSSYVAADGALAAEDEIVWDAGQFHSYRYVRHTIAETSRVERVGSLLRFTRRIGDQTDQAEEPFGPWFTAGPGVVPLIQANWGRLMDGEGLEVRYGVLDRLESIAFDIRRDRNHERNSKTHSVYRMRVSNPLLRLLVDPIHLVFTSDRHGFEGIIGRMLPVVVDQGRLRGVDAELTVTSVRSS